MIAEIIATEENYEKLIRYLAANNNCYGCPTTDNRCSVVGCLAALRESFPCVDFKTFETRLAASQRRADAAVTCKDCVYWKDRQVQLRDGSCRDYLPNEPWSVTADVGINVASHCTLHGFNNESGSWFWAKAEDFCSLGIRKPERSEG